MVLIDFQSIFFAFLCFLSFWDPPGGRDGAAREGPPKDKKHKKAKKMNRKSIKTIIFVMENQFFVFFSASQKHKNIDFP